MFRFSVSDPTYCGNNCLRHVPTDLRLYLHGLYQRSRVSMDALSFTEVDMLVRVGEKTKRPITPEGSPELEAALHD